MRSILYVDDEAALCRAFERALRSPEYRVVTTTSAPQAVELISTEPFDVIATDYRMPELNGLDILRAARELNPGARRLLVSGRIEGEVDEAILRDADIDHVLVKPWTLDELRRVVRRAVEFAEVARERTSLLEQLAARDRLQAADRRAQELRLLHGALELRDPGRAVHSRRVAQLARALGESLGLGGAELQAIEEGGLLHDIGTIGFSDGLLHKAGPLSEDEWREMTQHPELGARLIEGIDVLAGLAVIIRQHHERIDGQGYPHGLRGQEITLAARIVSVADAYEIMRGARSYQAERTHEAALAELEENAGTQFDRMVVETLRSLGPTVLAPA